MAEGQFSIPYSGVVGAGGSLTISIRPARMQKWTVSQVSTEMVGAPIGSICKLYKNGSLVAPLVSTGDVASGEPYIDLWATDVMTVVWSSVTPGLTGRALVFYTEG